MFAERLLARSGRRRRLDIEARARLWQHGVKRHPELTP